MSERPVTKRVGYFLLRLLSRLVAVMFFRMRCKGREKIPVVGGALVCSNHQSFFDPVLVGLGFNRRLNYIARKTLFGFGPFGWLIAFLDAIPIDRDGFGLAGIKETLKRLKRGEMVLIFPEGTRSKDGEIARLRPGFVALARRSRVPLLPVGVAGAFEAWPRNARLPQLSPILVAIGDPIPPDMINTWTDQQLVDEVERRIRVCHAEAHRGRYR